MTKIEKLSERESGEGFKAPSKLPLRDRRLAYLSYKPKANYHVYSIITLLASSVD